MLFGRGWCEGEEARPWAVALLRRAPEGGTPSEVLDDGSALHRTMLGYVPMALDGASAREWLATLGEELSSVHDDPRGVLFFPDVLAIRGRTYAEVVAEVGWSGVWVRSGACPPARERSASPRCGSS